MNILKAKIVMAAVVLSMSLAASRSEAHEHDFRTGTFYGNWCGFDAVFKIGPKSANAWVFSGTVTLPRTGQIDQITVEQFANNSLKITRYLSGAHTGSTQWVITHPPETKRVNGDVIVNFPVRTAGGYGAKILGFLQMPRQ